MRLRTFHRILGAALFIWLVNSAFSGLMRANAKEIYWKDRPPAVKMSELRIPAVEISGIMRTARAAFPPGTEIRSIVLKDSFGKQVYLVHGSSKAKNHYLLADPATGGVLSPIPEARAREIALAHVPPGTSVIKQEFLSEYLPRKAPAPRPAYRFLFDDEEKTEVFVDSDTSEVLTVLDRGRRFGLWMIKLHELEFFHLRRPALTLLGAATIVLSFSGIFLFFIKPKPRAGRADS